MIETKDIGLPGMTGKNTTTLTKYKVKYYRADLSDEADMLELSDIETKAIHSTPGSEEVVLMSTDKYTFMDRYFVVLKYLEIQD